MASGVKTLGGLAVLAFGLAAVYVAATSLGGGKADGPPVETARADAAAPTPAVLPALCMSDTELSAYLKHAALGPITYGAVQCAGRFPDLKAEADADIVALNAAQGATMSTISGASTAPFKRSYAAEAEKRRDARLATDQQANLQRIRAYSRDECKSHLAAIESFAKLSGADFDAVLATIGRQSWETQRTAVPACG